MSVVSMTTLTRCANLSISRASSLAYNLSNRYFLNLVTLSRRKRPPVSARWEPEATLERAFVNHINIIPVTLCKVDSGLSISCRLLCEMTRGQITDRHRTASGHLMMCIMCEVIIIMSTKDL